MSNELLYNQLYERTKDFGRSQFVREIMRLERENNQLKDYIKELEENSGVLVSQVESWHKTADIYLEKSIRLQQESKELHNKIDKAIEYIKETLDLKEEYPEEVECVVNDLLEILKDSDVDE